MPVQRRALHGLIARREHADHDVAQLRPEPPEVKRRLGHRGAVEVDEADISAVQEHLSRAEVVMGGNDSIGRALDRQLLQAREQRLGCGFQWRNAERQPADDLAKFFQLTLQSGRLTVGRLGLVQRGEGMAGLGELGRATGRAGCHSRRRRPAERIP